ncbi:MAG: hypothetical protein Q7U74_04465, partial [Saprospiraceae bacterium]|nr:hypothetical protein [Saprospiraceae bacterium]
MKNKKNIYTTQGWGVWLIAGVVFLSLLGSGRGYAAEGGARPISLGGAYIALADDVHVASWNPAGLAWQKEQEVTLSSVINNRGDYVSGDFISDDYFAYARPLKTGYQSDVESRGGFGVYFHNSGYENDDTRAKTSLMQPGISYGRRFSACDTMAWGVALNYYLFDSEIPGAVSSDAAFSANLGFLWYLTNKITTGFLWENINEPSFTVHGVNSRLVRVLRPGIAYYFTETSVLSCDIYDLTGNTKDRGADFSRNIRIGLEHYLTDSLSLRLGAHHPNSKVDSSKYYSVGFGLQRSDFVGVYPLTYFL